MLKNFPESLLEDIVEDKCVPIIGAGFSKNAKLPNGIDMPDWKQVGKFFADRMNYDADGPLDAISNFEYENKRAKTIEILAKILHIKNSHVGPGGAHLSFAALPFKTIITTNFDGLLEKAYEQNFKSYQTIVEEEQISLEYSENENKITRILKIHGDFEHPKNMIITEDDYDTYSEKYPLMSTHIANLLITKTPLFIGYSLDDPDFRGIWQIIRSRLGNNFKQAYAITNNSKTGVVTKFERRGVKIISLGT